VGVDPDPANNPRLMQWPRTTGWLCILSLQVAATSTLMMDEGRNLFRVNQNVKPA
jgi:hypothetical protein